MPGVYVQWCKPKLTCSCSLCLLLLMLCIVFIEVSDNQINFWTKKTNKQTTKTKTKNPLTGCLMDNLIYFQNSNAGCSTTSLFLFVCLFVFVLFVCFCFYVTMQGSGVRVSCSGSAMRQGTDEYRQFSMILAKSLCGNPCRFTQPKTKFSPWGMILFYGDFWMLFLNKFRFKFDSQLS